MELGPALSGGSILRKIQVQEATLATLGPLKVSAEGVDVLEGMRGLLQSDVLTILEKTVPPADTSRSGGQKEKNKMFSALVTV